MSAPITLTSPLPAKDLLFAAKELGTVAQEPQLVITYVVVP